MYCSLVFARSASVVGKAAPVAFARNYFLLRRASKNAARSDGFTLQSFAPPILYPTSKLRLNHSRTVSTLTLSCSATCSGVNIFSSIIPLHCVHYKTYEKLDKPTKTNVN